MQHIYDCTFECDFSHNSGNLTSFPFRCSLVLLYLFFLATFLFSFFFSFCSKKMIGKPMKMSALKVKLTWQIHLTVGREKEWKNNRKREWQTQKTCSSQCHKSIFKLEFETFVLSCKLRFSCTRESNYKWTYFFPYMWECWIWVYSKLKA